MKIRLTRTLPIDPKHGASKGREFEVLKYNPHVHGKRGDESVMFMGDAGEQVKAFREEYSVVREAAEGEPDE